MVFAAHPMPKEEMAVSAAFAYGTIRSFMGILSGSKHRW